LPIETNLSCTRAVALALGPERTHVFFRDLLAGALDTSILHSLVRQVLRVVVHDPGLYAPLVYKGYEALFPDGGKGRTLDRSESHLTTEYSGVPPQCLTDEVWPKSVASSTSKLFDVLGFEGSVVLTDLDAREERMRFLARWSRH
jgi:hypothetical protein